MDSEPHHSARPTQPVNLTAAAEPISWEQATRAIRIGGASEAAALDVQALSQSENGCRHDGCREVVYVVVAGFGVLRCEDSELEFTGGDVLFVPKGCPHHFDQLDRTVRIWRISAS
jgi:mannose-6-phosphate isomerase-like protein (cupin superfamily)